MRVTFYDSSKNTKITVKASKSRIISKSQMKKIRKKPCGATDNICNNKFFVVVNTNGTGFLADIPEVQRF